MPTQHHVEGPTMKFETFQDVLASIQKNNKRPFHLLLGNGFSMAYDLAIFSYNALHDFIQNAHDPDLETILGVIETKNFEVIMQQLGTCAALVDAFGGDPALRQRIEDASARLRSGLLDSVQKLHPEHVFKVPQKQSEACAVFLTTFLDTGGHLYSTNYDLLLYWVLMRNSVPHVDGFGREPENPDDPPDDYIWSELVWGKHRDDQNVFYLHGALPLFDDGVAVIKEEYDEYNYLLQKIRARMESAEYPIFVTAGDGRQKLTHIMHNHYLAYSYESLCTVDGSLVTFGFNFGEYDEHIINAINRAARQKPPAKLWSIYIGVYSDDDRQHIKQIEHKFKCKVHIYDTNTAQVWG